MAAARDINCFSRGLVRRQIMPIVRFAVPERFAKILGPGEEAWLKFEAGGPTGTGVVLAVDTLSYETGRSGEGLVTDVLVRPEESLLQSLSIGQRAVVALRR